MPLGKGRFRSVRVTENGIGKLVFIVMSSMAFAISGLLDKLPDSDLQQFNFSLEFNISEVVNNQGRRYCDPPNMTAFAIYYDSSEEAGDEDYDLLQNQLTVFQNNVSESDIQKHTGDIYSSCAFVLSFVPAAFLTSKYKPDTVFSYAILIGVVLKIIFFETGLPPEISVVTSGFLLVWVRLDYTFAEDDNVLVYCFCFQGVVMFSFYDMAFRFVTVRRNSVISFVSVRQVGLAIGELLTLLSSSRRYILYATTIITVVWFILSSRIQYKPSRTDMGEHKNRAKGSNLQTPWRKILGSRPVWMTTAAIFGASCGISSIFIAMRWNLKYVYFLPVETLSAISGFLHTGFAIICGCFIDYLTEHKIVSVTTSRRMVVYVSHFIPSGFLFVLGFLGCGITTPMIFYCLAVMTIGANYTGAFSSPLDLSPKYSRHILAFCFTFGSLGSLFMNYLIFYILTNQVFVSWRFIFSLNSLILLLTAIFFMLRGSGSIQPWNNPDHRFTKERKNNNIAEGRASVVEAIPKQRTKSIYMVEKKILKVLHVQEPDKFTRVRAYSTSFPNERTSANTPNIYRPSNKKRASIS